MMIKLIYPYFRPDQKNYGMGIPLGLLYLATVLKNNNFSVQLIDFAGETDSLDTLIKKLIADQPFIIGLPVFIRNQPSLIHIIKKIRTSGYIGKIVIGGQYTDIIGEKILQEIVEVDYVLLYEAEQTLVQLATLLIHGEGNLLAIKNLMYRDLHTGEILRTTEDKKLNQNLDLLPIPDRGFLEKYYHQGIYDRPYSIGQCDYLITSRGCLFRCNFCTPSAFQYRVRSAANVLAELRYLKNLGRKHIEIMDDSFLSNRARAIEICELILQEKLLFTFKVRGRADQIDEVLLRKLYQAGGRKLVLGIESGSNKILALMNKQTTAEQNARAISKAKKQGFEVYAHFIIGYPGETRDTIQETFDLLWKVKPHGISGNIYYPIPGTAGYKIAQQQGLLQGEWGFTTEQSPWVKLPWIENIEELWQILSSFKKSYYTNPLILFSLLSKLNLLLILKKGCQLAKTFKKLAT